MKTRKVSISVFQIFIVLLIIIAIIVSIIIIKKMNAKNTPTHKIEAFVGDGTSDNPYQIEKIEDLITLAQNVNNGESYKDKYFILTEKLDFQEDESYRNIDDRTFGDINKDGKIDGIKNELTQEAGFEPTGGKNNVNKNNTINAFEGIFNGNDKTIKNLLINVSNTRDSNFIGLFGYNKGTITNIRIIGNIYVDENIENKTLCIGMIVGKNEGTLQSCRTEGSIVSTINGDNSYAEVAGIAGHNTGTIMDSSSSVNITSNQLKAGIVAKNISDENITDSGNITNCTNTGEIKELVCTNNYTAGIVAENQKGSITSCTNDGKIEGRLVGGIAGNSVDGYIIACQNTGNITNIKENSLNEEIVGGIVAILESSTIENCKNTGNIAGLTNVGGIAGENKGSISQSRNEGNISKISETIASKINMGGIAGISYSEGEIINSKNFGNVNSEADNLVKLGGICGILYNNSLIDTCENNGNLYGIAKIITPNEDLSQNCKNCTNNAGGSAQNSESGELYLGLIYGKFEEANSDN